MGRYREDPALQRFFKTKPQAREVLSLNMTDAEPDGDSRASACPVASWCRTQQRGSGPIQNRMDVLVGAVKQSDAPGEA